MALTEDRIREALAAVTDPSQNRNVIELGLVTSIKISDSNVGIIMEVPAHRGPALEPIRKRVEEAVLAMDGVTSATVIMTAHEGSDTAACRPARCRCLRSVPAAHAGGQRQTARRGW